MVKRDNGRLTQVKEYYEKSCRCWSKLGGAYSVVEGEIFFLGGGGEIFLRGKTQRGLQDFSWRESFTEMARLRELQVVT